MPQYEYYLTLKNIRERLIENSLEFFHLFKHKKYLLGKNEKYFRRAYFSQLVEYDRFYHMRLISTYRKYLVYYRELKFEEMPVVFRYLSSVTFYSHVKLFKIKESCSNLKVVENVFKCYIKQEDRVLIDHSLFKTSLMLLNLKPDSVEAYDFLKNIIHLVEKKFNKIPITTDNQVSNLKKFDRIIDVLNSTVAVCISKVSDVTMLLTVLNKFRLTVDKFKFNFTGAIESLKVLTNYVNYFLPKPATLFDRKIELALSPYLFDSSESQKRVNDSNTRDKIRNYIFEVLNDFDNRFNSNNYYDSLNLIIDFFTTVKLSLDFAIEEDKKLLEEVEKICLKKFMEEDDDFIKKRIFLAGMGLVCNLRYRVSKIVVKSSELESEFNSKRNFDPSYGSNDKIYNPSTVEIYNNLFKSEEDIAKIFEVFYKFQEKDQLNLLKNTGGVFENVNRKLQNLIYPQYKDSALIFERNFLLTSLSESPSLFSPKWARIIFFMFYFSGLFEKENDFSVIFAQYEKFKAKENSEDIVAVNTLMMFSFALIKKYRINEEFRKITLLMKKIMTLYTFNTNKRVDTEILNLFASVIRVCSPRELKQILTNESDQKLFILGYEHLFSMRMVDLLSQRFEERCHLVFNEESLRELDKIKEDIMKDPIEWMKNASTFEYFLMDYLRIKRIKQIDNKNNYVPFYKTDEIVEMNENLLEFFRKSQTKESLKLLNILFRESLPLLMTMPELLVEIVSEFTCYKRLDPQNYKKRLEYNVGIFHQLNKFKSIDYLKFVELLAKKMDTYVYSESFRFCTDVLRKLLTPRLHQIIIGSEMENFENISKVVEVAKTQDNRDYFLHYVIYKVIHSLQESTIVEIISKLTRQIKQEKASNNSKMVISLVTLLTSFLMDYEIIISHSTELAILKLRELNKLFKNIGNESKIIKKSISLFYNKYSYTFPLLKKQVSEDCIIAVSELSKSQAYFI